MKVILSLMMMITKEKLVAVTMTRPPQRELECRHQSHRTHPVSVPYLHDSGESHF